MYDLMPMRLSARSRYVAFDDTTAAALSPLRHLDRLHAPLVVAYRTCETLNPSARIANSSPRLKSAAKWWSC
jgi:arylformamidase